MSPNNRIRKEIGNKQIPLDITFAMFNKNDSREYGFVLDN